MVTTPGSTTATRFTGSISRMRFIFSRERTMPPQRGTAAPARPLPAPLGVTGILYFDATFMTAATCSALSAFTTASGMEVNMMPASSEA